MSHLKRLSLFFLLLLLTIGAVACREDEPDPTSTPEATSEAESPTAEPTDAPTAEPTEPAGNAAVDPNNITWPPQVVYSSPQPGEEAELDGAITIRFDQPMDQDSVVEAFAIEAADGQQDDDGNYSWPNPSTLVYTPRGELDRATRYRVTIGEGARGQNGQTLPEPVNLQVETVGFLEVAQVLPAPEAAGTRTDGAITVFFNRPVVPLVATTQQGDLPDPLTISPPVEGTGEWTSTSIFRFQPDEPLAGATEYQVTVDQGLADVTGGVLADPFSWSFTTVSPSVVETTPDDGTERYAPTEPLTITFNMPMDPSVATAAISLETDNGGSAPALDAEWTEDGRTVRLTPATRLPLETAFDLVIGSGAASANGAATLEEEVRVEFTTVPFPAVEQVNPRNGETTPVFIGGVSVNFVSLMDSSTLRDQIRIEPQPDDVRTFNTELESTQNVFLQFNPEPRTQYTVTVPGSAADIYGNTLGEDFTWSFNVEGLPPLAAINLPGGSLGQMTTNGPTTLEVAGRSVSRLDVALYDLGLDLDLLAEPRQINDAFAPPNLLREWELETADAESGTPEIFELNLASDGGTLPTGVYIVEAGAPELDSDSRFWQQQRGILVVAGTNLVVKEMFGEIHVWATNLSNGQPATGRSVTFYDVSTLRELGTATTDGQGLATLEVDRGDSYLPGILAIAGSPGDAGFGIAGSNWGERVNPWDFGFNGDYGDEPQQFVYVTTDRPIYRPGDTLFFRGVVRSTDYGRYGPPSLEEVTVVAEPAFYVPEGGDRFTTILDLDENYNFTGEFTLPEEMALGNYIIRTESPDARSGVAQVTVAEYRTPEFLVNTNAEQSELLRGETVDVVVEAEYFFGGPATDLEVNWSAYVEPFAVPFADAVGGGYSFGLESTYFYDPFNQSGRTYLTDGQGQTDGEGRFVITLPADLLAEQPEGTRTVTVEANLLGLSETPVAARTAVTFHAADYYVGIQPTDYLGAAGFESSVDLLTTDWDGEPVGNRPVEVVFYRREWEPVRNEFDPNFVSWEPQDSEVDRVSVTTDAQGETQATFTPPEGGTYYIEATVTDDAGRTQSSSTFLWVTDSAFVGWRSNEINRRMDLVLDQSSYQVGDTAQVLVQSPFEGPIQAWLTIERGQMIEQQVITLESNSDTIDVPIEAIHAPNAYLGITAIRDGSGEAFADIRVGMAELVVSPERLALDVEIAPQQEILQPRDTAIYDLRVTDYSGDPVQADVSLALVDLAVLTLKPDTGPGILETFYARQPLRSRIGSGLLVTAEGLEFILPEAPGGFGGGGGGEAVAEEALALDEEARGEEGEGAVRQDFRDTAYWEGIVSTDADGTASVEVTLPDNLTTWRMSAKAVSADTLVGEATRDIVSTLPVLIRPVTPRFFTVGDEVRLGAIVNNNSGSAQSGTVTLEADGVTIDGPASREIEIEDGGSELVRWTVTVEDVQYVDLTFRVDTGEYSDATKPTLGEGPDQLLPVYRYSAEDIVGTSGVIDEPGRRVEAILLPPNLNPNRGSVIVEMSPSLAAALFEALDYTETVDFDPQCAAFYADRLLTAVSVDRAIQQLGLEKPAAADLLAQRIPADIISLEEMARGDGGWSWCQGSDSSNPFLSAYILFILSQAEEMGYDVNARVRDRALDYLEGQITAAERLNEASEVNRQAFFLYVLAENDVLVAPELDELVEEHRELIDPYAKALMLLGYEVSGASGDSRVLLLGDLNDVVVLSGTGAHWEDTTRDRRNLSSDVRGTALVVSALTKVDPENPLIPQAVRWLMAARTASHWSTTHETALTVMALTDWALYTGELDATYGYALGVNTETAVSGTITPEDVTESIDATIPVADLAPDDVNFFNFQMTEGDGTLYYTLHLDSYLDASVVEATSRGITVQRTYYDAACDPETETCESIDQIDAGQQIRVELTIIAPNDLVYVQIDDPFPAGAEGQDPNLATTVSSAQTGFSREEYETGFWGWWYFNRVEFRDEKVTFFSEFLPAGTYQYTYTLQPILPGTYQVMPAVAREVYFPEVFGRTDGQVFTITE